MSNKLEILIEAVDKATKEIQGIKDQINGLKKSTEDTGQTTEKHTGAMVKQWAKVGLAIFGVANIVRFLARQLQESVALAGKHDAEYTRTMDNFKKSVEKLKIEIGERLIPYLKTAAEYWGKMLDGAETKSRQLTSSQKQLIDQLKVFDEQLRNMEMAKATSGKWDDFETGLNAGAYQKTIDARLALIRQLHELEIQAEQEKTEEIKVIKYGALAEEMQKEMQNDMDRVNYLRMTYALWYNEKTQMAMASMQQETEFYTFAIDNQKKAHQSMWTLAGTARDTFVAGTTKGLMAVITQTGSAAEAAKQMGFQLIEAVIQFGIQKVIASALSKTLLATEVAAATVSGAAVAAAWAEAAAMVSLATFGSNAVPASTGIASTIALAKTLAMPTLAEGGIVNRPTIALIGEAGPEAVVPLGKGGGGRQYVHIEINYPTIRSTEDIDALTEEISTRLAREADRL